MGVEGVSDRADKVYQTLKGMGAITEEKMMDAERITQNSKMPKGQVMACLQELEGKGYIKRRARDKAAGYYITKVV